MQTALNHMTVPNLGYIPFLELAAKLGCVGVEVRNDISRPLFDNLDPAEAGQIASDKGLRLVGLSQVYPFNDWNPEREDAVKSLIAKIELVEMIASVGGEDHFKIVHDTFHHTLADGGPIFPEMTGIVHISAVVDPKLGVSQLEDEHRVLVDEHDRLGNVEQIASLLAAGYDGPVSYECFSPETHALDDPYSKIKRSFDFISSRLQALAA